VPDAENHTSAREGRTITYAGKKVEIDVFMERKKALEAGMKTIVLKQLKSTEVNKALNEIDAQFSAAWHTLLEAQFQLYSRAKRESPSNLGFDMWFEDIASGYVWTHAATTTDQEVDALPTGDVRPVDATTLTCTR
jgi:hypothetical protein